MHVLPFLLGSTHSPPAFADWPLPRAGREGLSPNIMIPTDCSEFQFSRGSPGWEDPHFLTSGLWGTEVDGAERAAGGSEPLADSAWSVHCYWSEMQNNLGTAFSFSDHKPCYLFLLIPLALFALWKLPNDLLASAWNLQHRSGRCRRSSE